MTTRRRFISQLATAIGGTAAGKGFTGFPTDSAHASVSSGSQSNVSLPATRVSVVKSDKELATEIGEEEIRTMVRESVERAGGFGDIIGDGATVVLKPNMVSYYDMSSDSGNVPLEANGICTDRRVARAVVEMVRDINPHGTVYILEGAANGTTREAMDWLGYNHETIPGVDDFVYLEEVSGGWEEWDSENLVGVTLPDGVGLYPDDIKPNKSKEFYLNKLYYEADALISLPLLKNHSNTNMTGSVKNLGIGGTPTNIYGGAPGDNHRYINNRISHISYNLHRFIHDFYLCRPADFTIMEGIQGLSYGPVAQGAKSLEDAQENMRIMLAGRDAVALDAVASYIMNIDPHKVRHLRFLCEEGHGTIDPSGIRIDSARVQDIRKRFRLWSLTDSNATFGPPDPPAVTVDDCFLSGADLKLKLTTSDSTVKVEVAIDGVTLPEDILEGYDDITLDVSSAANINRVTVTAYDTYFGSSSVTIPFSTHVETPFKRKAEAFELLQNSPNPFNPETVIPYRLSRPGMVNVRVYDATGQVVRVLASGWKSAGLHTVRFDGSGCASGTYMCRLEYNGKSATRKMTLIK